MNDAMAEHPITRTNLDRLEAAGYRWIPREPARVRVRSGGPGGQGVNTTNSAVQVTHLPTGMIVKCQDERSQIKNKARALKVLRSRLLELERQKQADEERDERRSMVGSGERSEKIRTYNFPQNRLTDHRIGLTLHKLDRVVEGDIDDVISAVRAFHQAAQLQGKEEE
jgi:peptide chain release factor 1